MGNSRVSFSDITAVAGIELDDRLQTNTYYPYGSNIAGLSSANQFVGNDYKYNNKEMIDDLGLNMLDYGARLYDPLTGRWNGVDALAEKYHSTATYGYVSGNPISKIDPDGRGEYYANDGRYLGSDEKKDNLVYVTTEGNYHYSLRVGKKPNYNTLRTYSTLLDITHTEFQKMANTIRQEGLSNNPDEYLYIAHANNNYANNSSRYENMYDLLMSGYSAVEDKSPLPTSNNTVRANHARAGLIDVLLGGEDPTGGASLWDGEDFLAWGLISCNGKPQNKFKEYNNLQISCSLYNTYLVNIQNKRGNCMRFKRYPCNGAYFDVPSEVFLDPKNWGTNGFSYNTNVKTKQRIEATAVIGPTIFWKIVTTK